MIVWYVYTEKVIMITNYNEDMSYLAKFNINSQEFTKVLAKEGEDFADLKYSKEHINGGRAMLRKSGAKRILTN